MAKKKPATVEEKKHMSRVANLGCVACAQLGHYDSPAEIHHIKNHTGMGRRSSHFEVIPLCYLHHRGTYGYHTSPSEFTGNYGTQIELLKMVTDWLDYEDKKTGQIEASNPYTRNNLFYE